MRGDSFELKKSDFEILAAILFLTADHIYLY